MPVPDRPNRTYLAEERVARGPYYQPPVGEEKHGYYAGRPIIGRDTRINGGVYLGGHEREAIVVDDTKQRGLLPAFDRLRKELVVHSALSYMIRGNLPPNQRTMQSILGYTQRVMPYNPAVVELLTADLGPDEKISLSSFLRHGGGVCRHQALLSGYFVEKLIDRGYLAGEAHVERNQTPDGAHAWMRYTPVGVDPSTDSFIIDPAQNFAGTQAQAKLEAHWAYPSPE